MFKDILIPTTATSGDDDALNAGIAIAAAFDAKLTVLETVSLPSPVGNPWGLTPDAAMADVYSRLRTQGEINVGRLKARLDKETIQSEVRLAEAMFVESERIAAHHAHYADLVVVAGSIGDTNEGVVTHAYFGGLLLESGRPVLVVPPRCQVISPPKRIVLAWRPTRESTRAVHDAMPFLTRAEQIDVLVVNAARGELGHGEEPGADIAAHLARHGVKTNVIRRDAGPTSIGSVILQQARESYAQMIVAGGYGHSRLREWAMGGVTRELMLSAQIPVFYSH